MKIKQRIGITLLLCLTSVLVLCVSILDGITTVSDFQTEKHLEKWYKIANYDNVLAAGEGCDYLWILSLNEIIPKENKLAFIKKAEPFGFNISDLIWVENNQEIVV